MADNYRSISYHKFLLNLSKKYAIDFEFPDEYFKSDYARKSEIIRECSKNMGFSRLLEILDDYCRFEKEAEERSYQERFQDRVEEIISNISARQFVMKKFQEEGSG